MRCRWVLVKAQQVCVDPVSSSISRFERQVRRFDTERLEQHLRIDRGVETNLRFLRTLINHPRFIDADYTTLFVDDTPELFHFPESRDKTTNILRFIGDVIVNGNEEVKDRASDRSRSARREFLNCRGKRAGRAPCRNSKSSDRKGSRSGCSMKRETLITDTTFRDAHQSILATRVRSYDLMAIAPAYSKLLPDLFSAEFWGGATFDVAMRFLQEDPWERLIQFKALVSSVDVGASRPARPLVIERRLRRASRVSSALRTSVWSRDASARSPPPA